MPPTTPTKSATAITLQADETWIDAAISCGFTGDTLSRADCQMVKTKTARKLPRWLMKDPGRRLARGSYFLPELPLRLAAIKAGTVTQTPASQQAVEAAVDGIVNADEPGEEE